MDRGDFIGWLRRELEKRGWRQADLARASGLDTAMVSNLLNGNRKPGEVSCKAIARGLGLPPETVFRAAGILPPINPVGEAEAELGHLFRQATDRQRQEVLRFARYVIWNNNARPEEQKEQTDAPIENSPVDVSEWLRDETARRRWSQADMARESGLSRQAISKYFQGRGRPDIKSLHAIARAFGYTPESVLRVLGWLPPDHERTPQTDAVIEAMTGMPEEWQDEIAALVRRMRRFYEILEETDT